MQFSVYLFTKNMSLQQQVVDMTNTVIINQIRESIVDDGLEHCECGEILTCHFEERDGHNMELIWECPKCD